MRSFRRSWLDVTAPLTERLPAWPGDPHFELKSLASVERDGYELSSLAMSAHAGTHLDAPRHYRRGGAGTAAAPPETLVGPARVVELPGRSRLTAADLERLRIRPGQRLLLKTDNSRDSWWEKPWEGASCSLAPEAALWLARAGVRLVGIDHLSISGEEDTAAVHLPLLEAGVWVLEGLKLDGVLPGRYRMLCLPLAMDAEAAPARVFLSPRCGPRHARGASSRKMGLV